MPVDIHDKRLLLSTIAGKAHLMVEAQTLLGKARHRLNTLEGLCFRLEITISELRRRGHEDAAIEASAELSVLAASVQLTRDSVENLERDTLSLSWKNEVTSTVESTSSVGSSS